MPGMTTAPPLPPETIERLRVVLITDKGPDRTPGRWTPAAPSPPNPDWLRIVVPLSSFAMPTELAGAKLLGAVVTGNVPGTFNVGQLYLKSEQPPLVAKVNGERVITTRVRAEGRRLRCGPGRGREGRLHLGLSTSATAWAPRPSDPPPVLNTPSPATTWSRSRSLTPTGARETRVDQILVVVKK